MRKRFIILITVAVISASFYFGLQKVRADSVVDWGVLISKQNISISRKNNFILSKYQKEKNINWVITKIGLWTNQNLVLAGFEDSVQLCQKNVYQIGDIQTLCLSGFVGAHAENVVLIDLTKFQPIEFTDFVGKHFNIISDVPYFIFSNNEKQIFISDMRNYDKNPLSDSIRNYYSWDGQRFVFDKDENITYDGKNIIIEGAI